MRGGLGTQPPSHVLSDQEGQQQGSTNASDSLVTILEEALAIEALVHIEERAELEGEQDGRSPHTNSHTQQQKQQPPQQSTGALRNPGGPQCCNVSHLQATVINLDIYLLWLVPVVL